MSEFDRIKRELGDSLQRAIEQYRPDSAVVQRVMVDVNGIDPLDWLTDQRFHTKFFWSRRDHTRNYAGIGAVHHLISDSVEILKTVHKNLTGSHPDIRYYGGMRFDPDMPVAREWFPFAKYRFVIPRFELITNENQQCLAVNYLLKSDSDRAQVLSLLLQDIEKLTSATRQSESLPNIQSMVQEPDETVWDTIVGKALRSITQKEYEKIVLAGRSELTLDGDVNPFTLLRHLLHQNGNSYHFAFQFQKTTTFLGMPPECLFQRTDDMLCTEAIASTRPRGKTSQEDDRLARALLQSDKDLREHRLVKKMILERLQPFCNQIEEKSSENVLKLAHVQHLISEFCGQLKTPIRDDKVLSALHPTPAVGGYPKQQTVNRIGELEPFDRGWYAAPVGWISQNAAEFAVAIRSALCCDSKLYIYSGSGIVEGSDPGKEWEENRNKAQNFMQLFHRS